MISQGRCKHISTRSFSRYLSGRRSIQKLLDERNNEDPDDFINRILSSGGAYDDLLHRPLLLTTRCIAAGLPASSSLRRRILDEVCQLWAEPPFWRMREIINQIVGETTDSDFADDLAVKFIPLMQKTYAEDWGGSHATRILGKIGKRTEAISILLRLAQRESYGDEGDVDEKLAAVVELGELGETETAAISLLALASDPRIDEYNRRAAIEALGDLGVRSAKVLQNLLALARDEGIDALARWAATKSLIKLGEPQPAISILRSMAQDETVDERARRRAAEVLGQSGERELAVCVLLKLGHDERSHLVCICRAAKALAQLGERQTAIVILLAAARDERPCVACGEKSCMLGRRFAAQILAELGEVNAATSILLSWLQDEALKSSGRLDAAEALARLGKQKEATPVLLALMHDKNAFDFVRKNATAALGKWGERSERVVQELLIQARREELDVWERRYAIEALGNLGNRRQAVLQTIAEIARTNPDSALRPAACEALWKLVNGGSSSHKREFDGA